MEDTRPLQKFGLMTEETLQHIYYNNLFEQLEEVIIRSLAPYIYSLKEPENELGNELEDDWELEP